MKYVKMLGLLAIAAAALMAFAGTASATVTTLTSPEGTEYNGTIEATSTNGKLTGSFVAVTCSHSVAKGKVETNGVTAPAGGKVTSLSFSGCNYKTTVGKEGTLTINSSNQVVSNGAEVEIETSVGTCVFTTNNTTVGTLTEGSPAVMNINSAKIARTGGSFLCGSSGTWTGSYTVISPSSLYVD